MIELFKEYKDAGKISEALLVGRNALNKKPGDIEMFRLYADLLISLSETLPSFDERKDFERQANVTLAFFEENVDMTSESIKLISEYHEKIDAASKSIFEEKCKRSETALNEIQSNNAKQIKSLYAIKQKLANAKTQEELDKVLQEMGEADAGIQHEYLTVEQSSHYDFINKECTAAISDKMRDIEHAKNVEYNKRAVDAYDKAFKKFKSDEGKYKNQTQLFSLVSSTLFAYDASRLFNETLIFYNHVYSYIFSKLDDDGKLALTRFSIACERKLR